MRHSLFNSDMEKGLIILMVIVIGAIFFAPTINQPSSPTSPSDSQTIWVEMPPLKRDPTYLPRRIPPPPGVEIGAQANNIFVVTNGGVACGGGELSTDALAAFNYALDIWATFLDEDQIVVDIAVDVCSRNLGNGGTLGSGGSQFSAGFFGAPVSNTFYPTSLGNQFAGQDLSGTAADIFVTFNNNSAINWYFGTDGNTPAGQTDFVSTALHETGHGLGLNGFMTVSNGDGTWGSLPAIFDNFAEDNSGNVLVNTYGNPSTALANILTSEVYFGGTNATAANNDASVALHAPDPFVSGTSYSHLDDSFDTGDNADPLMTHSLNDGESVHSPGLVTLNLFRDLGWDILINADLSLSTSISPDPVQPTTTAVNYTITLQNNGTIDATGVTITSTMPTSTTYESSSPTGTFDGTYLVWQGLTVAAQSSSTVSFQASVSSALNNGNQLVNAISATSVEGASATLSANTVTVATQNYVYLPLIVDNN